ncbi:MAG: hypothetical protein KA220_09015, partial [Phenylobacterium sp.]|nr:hypothetical protein [Phenylobacterium sp.]
ITGLRSAHALLRKLGAGADFAIDQAPASAYERILVRLAFLAPDIQAAILEGRQPQGLTLHSLLKGDIPPGWEDQRQRFGFGAAA